LAAAIKDTFRIESELIPGSGGIFEVKVDGRLIFSKSAAGRFPETAEILDAIK